MFVGFFQVFLKTAPKYVFFDQKGSGASGSGGCKMSGGGALAGVRAILFGSKSCTHVKKSGNELCRKRTLKHAQNFPELSTASYYGDSG